MQKNWSKWFRSPYERWSKIGIPGKTYIVPTRAGMYMAGFCFVFLGMAYAYQNNLVYLLVFLAFSFFVTSMFLCNRNVAQFQAEQGSLSPFFADSVGEYHVQVTVPRTEFSRQMSLSSGQSSAYLDLQTEQKKSSIVFKIISSEIGLHPLPSVAVNSQFPYQLFFCWKSLKIQGQYLVYPARNGVAVLPESLQQGSAFEGKSRLGTDQDFAGHQLWNTSMSYRRIDWKVKARTGSLMTQQFEGGFSGPLHLDWKQTSFLTDKNRRLEQLSLWVDMALRSGRDFDLKIGKQKSDLGSGLEHAHQCWRMLSLTDLREL